MDKHMTEPTFNPGFRISMSDAAVLTAGGCGSIFCGIRNWQMGLITGFAVGHFFLFCNVFRIRRKPELSWATLFVILVSTTVTKGVPGWPLTIALSSLMTVSLILLEMKKPSYHGVGWRKVNPQLQTWWEAERNRKLNLSRRQGEHMAAERKWPYNLPIWRRSLRLSSPDGRLTAEIPKTMEVSMSNPTIGTLVFSTGLKIEACNPSFIWSDDSKYLAVPQYCRSRFWGIGRQCLLVVNPVSKKAWRSGKLAYYIQPETFCDQQLAVTLDPFRRNKRTLTFGMSQILRDFESIELPSN